MEHDYIEDSIDDLISLLNSQKTPNQQKSHLREAANVNLDNDATELGRLLNSPFLMNPKPKPIIPPRNNSFEAQKLVNRALNSSLRPQDNNKMKSELIPRNYLNKTSSYTMNRESAKEFSENKYDQEEVNLTLHPKVPQVSLARRFLVFQPLLEDVNYRPKTPPDHGYYFKFSISDVKLIKYLFQENGFRETNNNNAFSIMWSCGAIKNEIYQCLGYYQKVNHFPRSHEITRKDNMHRNISRMQTTYGLKNFNFIPKSFILPMETPLLEKDFEKNKGISYIVKPQASSQGRGIFITNNLDEILAKQNNDIIVSHYLNDPFLINGLKFDLRVYVALTSVHPLRIYIYKEGLVRFATAPYAKDADSLANRFVHLTNYSINKQSDGYVPNDDVNDDEESCSKWSFTTFRNYLESQGIDHKKIFANIDDLIIKTILSIESILFSTNVIQVPQRHNCFELFGFDILLDSKLKPWLLEVNLSPSLACESALDLKIKSELISDLFNMAGVVPLDQRTYNEPSLFGKNQNLYSYGATGPSFDKKSSTTTSYSDSKIMETLTKDERAVIKETNEEWERRGKFKRIFPSATVNEYKNYFEAERPYNKLLKTLISANMGKDYKKQDSGKGFQNPKRFG